MRLVKYEARGHVRIGARVGDRIVETPWPTFEAIFAEPDPLATVRALELDKTAVVEPDRLLPPVVNRCQIIGTGGNYADHLAEIKGTVDITEPVFMSILWSAVIGPDEAIEIPDAETQADYEVELAVVIGNTARRLTIGNAMDHVFGYTVLNDVSARDVMVRNRLQITLSKSPDTFCPVGPQVVTRDEIADPYNLEIATYLNGDVRQHSNTAQMMVRIPELLSALTRKITLRPGDLVTTGTPGGVGFFRQPQEFMKPGDVITASIAEVGNLTNRVVKGW